MGQDTAQNTAQQLSNIGDLDDLSQHVIERAASLLSEDLPAEIHEGVQRLLDEAQRLCRALDAEAVGKVTSSPRVGDVIQSPHLTRGVRRNGAVAVEINLNCGTGGPYSIKGTRVDDNTRSDARFRIIQCADEESGLITAQRLDEEGRPSDEIIAFHMKGKEAVPPVTIVKRREECGTE